MFRCKVNEPVYCNGVEGQATPLLEGVGVSRATSLVPFPRFMRNHAVCVLLMAPVCFVLLRFVLFCCCCCCFFVFFFFLWGGGGGEKPSARTNLFGFLNVSLK